MSCRGSFVEHHGARCGSRLPQMAAGATTTHNFKEGVYFSKKVWFRFQSPITYSNSERTSGPLGLEVSRGERVKTF
jgi:hypothetical protein